MDKIKGEIWNDQIFKLQLHIARSLVALPLTQLLAGWMASFSPYLKIRDVSRLRGITKGLFFLSGAGKEPAGGQMDISMIG